MRVRVGITTSPHIRFSPWLRPFLHQFEQDGAHQMVVPDVGVHRTFRNPLQKTAAVLERPPQPTAQFFVGECRICHFVLLRFPYSIPRPISLLSSRAEGEPMANLSAVLQALRKERQRAQHQVERIDAALAALGSLNSRGRAGKRGHTMSAGARRKIAAAQRARWAKLKAKKA